MNASLVVKAHYHKRDGLTSCSLQTVKNIGEKQVKMLLTPG